MKGLIYKDLSLMGRQGKFFLVYILFFCGLFAFVTDGSAAMISFLSVVCFMLSINCFAYDEQSNFDKLVAASPVRPAVVVAARYISSFLVGLIGCVLTAGISSVVQLIRHAANFYDMLGGSAAAIAVALLLISILFPFFYKFGVNKSRIIMLLVFALPAVGIPLLSQVYPQAFDVLEHIPQTVLTFLPYIAVAVILVLLAASLCLSCAIVKRKQY